MRAYYVAEFFAGLAIFFGPPAFLFALAIATGLYR